MKIAIPSYQRSDTIGPKTLTTLQREGFLAGDINIFVANEQEAELYRQKVPRTLYNEIIVGVLGIAPQRIFISQYYPEDTFLLYCDDDLRGFKRYRGFERIHLPSVFENLFTHAQLNRSFLWGLYPASNPLFFKPRIRNGLHLICGSCYGFINRHQLSWNPTLLCKEDYDLSFKAYLQTGNLTRAEFVSPITSYWKTKGGLQTVRTFDTELLCSRRLFIDYPELVEEVFTKKNGKPDLKLRKFPSTFHPVELVEDDRVLF